MQYSTKLALMWYVNSSVGFVEAFHRYVSVDQRFHQSTSYPSCSVSRRFYQYKSHPLVRYVYGFLGLCGLQFHASNSMLQCKPLSGSKLVTGIGSSLDPVVFVMYHWCICFFCFITSSSALESYS